MTYSSWAMLAGVAVVVLAVACEGSQRGDSPTATQIPEQQVAGRALIIGINQSGGLLTLIDPLAGVVVGSVDAGYRPDVLFRRTSGQLLVSQAFGPGQARSDEPSLAIFDLDNVSSPSAIISMPGWPSFTVYSPNAVLSRDERYLYYARVTGICPNGGDSAVCDKWSISVIDLEAERQVAQAEIGVGCIPRIHVEPEAEQTVLVTCSTVAMTLVEFTPDAVRLLRIGPDGAATALGTFPGRRPAGQITSVLFAGQRVGGTYFAVYGDGAVFDAGGEEALADLLLEEDGQFGFNTGAALGSERYLLAFGAEWVSGTFSGVVVLNAAAPEDARTFDVPFAFQHVAPLDERRVALLHGDGFEVSVLDVETGDVSDAMTLPERVDWLSGG